jgi:hypothetical protein
VVLVQGPSRKDVFGKDLGSLRLGETESYATPFRIVIGRTPK